MRGTSAPRNFMALVRRFWNNWASCTSSAITTGSGSRVMTAPEISMPDSSFSESDPTRHRIASL